MELFRQSGTQINEAAPLDRATAKAGDLVYYPGHVMLYLGVGDAIIHSVQTGRTVEIDTISGRRVRLGPLRRPDRLTPSLPMAAAAVSSQFRNGWRRRRRAATAPGGPCAGR